MKRNAVLRRTAGAVTGEQTALQTSPSSGITRQVFLRHLAGGGVLLLLGGCDNDGDDDRDGRPSGDCLNWSISANHLHQLILPAADLNSMTERTYNIQGGAGHNHTLTLTPAQFAQLRAGQPISVTSSSDDTILFGRHSHDVSGRCA